LSLRRTLLICLALLTFDASAALGHGRSQSFSAWQANGDRLQMVYTIEAREATRLLAVAGGGADRALGSHLAASMELRRGEHPCRPDAPVRQLRSGVAHLRFEASWLCPAGGEPVMLRVDTLLDVAPSHVHFARLATSAGGQPIERVYTTGRRQHALTGDPREAPAVGFGAWVRLGIGHILGGPDHLAFLLGLLLLARDARSILLLVTGFTVGHSITLALSSLGVLRADAATIEALIGWSVALVAIESLLVGQRDRRWAAVAIAALLLSMLALGWAFERGPAPILLVGLALFSVCFLALAGQPREARRLRPGLTVLFGLVHGFGFATVLTEVGLSRERLLPALLGFNVGVELGQLAVVALLLGLGGLAARRFGRRPWVGALLSSALCGVGLYWFLTRSLTS
jgi:hypothetical protein